MLHPHLLTSVLEFGHKSGCKVGGSEVHLSNYIVTRGRGERQESKESFERIERT